MRHKSQGRIDPLPFILIFFLVFQFACQKKPTGPQNKPPEIKLHIEGAFKQFFHSAETITIKADIEDEDDLDSLSVKWSASGGEFVSQNQNAATWQAPSIPGPYTIRLKAIDTQGAPGIDSLTLQIENRAPQIQSISPKTPIVVIGNTVRFRCTASDSDGQTLTYTWTAATGRILWAQNDSMLWEAPQEPGQAEIRVTVSDEYHARDTDTTTAVVYREAGSIWIVDTGNHDLVKISAEGGVLFRISGFLNPNALALDPRRRFVWVADPALGKVSQVNFSGTIQSELSGLGGPTDLDIYQINGRAWVVEADSNRVSEIANDGQHILRRCFGFQHPSALSVDQSTGDLYIADTGAHRVVKLISTVPDSYNVAKDSSYHLIYRGFSAPADIQSDLLSGKVWVVDKLLEKVSILEDSNAIRLSISGLRLPSAVALDSHRKIAWIADTGNGRVLKVKSMRIVQEITGLLLPHDLAVDPIDGSLWIADTENDRLLKYSLDGTQRLRLYGFSSPRALVVNPGQ